MKTNRRHRGVTLIEIAMVIAVVSILVALAMPAVKTLTESIQSESSGTKFMVESTLKQARAIAIREQRYAGVRFQTEYTTGNPLDASQYMIPVVYGTPKEMGNDKSSFRAVEGAKPVKLPKSVGIMDLRRNDGSVLPAIQDINRFLDTTTFMIIFSPAGKCVSVTAQVRNRNGIATDNAPEPSLDEVFNTEGQVANGIGMFLQDYDEKTPPADPYGNLIEEKSRSNFVIFDRSEFKEHFDQNTTGNYIIDLQKSLAYVTAYGGLKINEQ